MQYCIINYYQVLGLSFGASVAEVRKAYREYVKHFHPDKQQNSSFFTERFKEVQQAYELLSDDKSRIQFEQDFSSKNNAEVAKKLLKELEEERTRYSQQAKKLLDSDANVQRLAAENAELKKQGRENVRKPNPALSYVRQNRNKLTRWGLIAVLPLFLLYKFLEPERGINLRVEWDKLNSMLDAGKFTDAIERSDSLLKSGITIVPNTTKSKTNRELGIIDLLTMRGYAKSKIQNDTGAIKDLTAVIRRGGCSNDDVVFGMRGELKQKLGDTIGALQDYGTAIGVGPVGEGRNRYRALENRAELFCTLKEYDKALRDYKAAVKIGEAEGNLLNSYGNCYYAMGRLDSACVMWRSAGEVGSADAYKNLKDFCR